MDLQAVALIDALRKSGTETSCVEFKESYADPPMIGKLISALSNAARIDNRDVGYVVWGIRDGDHAVTGTTFDPAFAKYDGQPLQFRLAQKLTRNRELRERFGVESRNAAQISDVICRALDADLIRIADPARPRSGYAPFWALS